MKNKSNAHQYQERKKISRLHMLVYVLLTFIFAIGWVYLFDNLRTVGGSESTQLVISNFGTFFAFGYACLKSRFRFKYDLHYIPIALLFQLSAIFISVARVQLAQFNVDIGTNLRLFFTLVLCWSFLSKRFTGIQILGSSLIFVGYILKIVTNNEKKLNSHIGWIFSIVSSFSYSLANAYFDKFVYPRNIDFKLYLASYGFVSSIISPVAYYTLNWGWEKENLVPWSDKFFMAAVCLKVLHTILSTHICANLPSDSRTMVFLGPSLLGNLLGNLMFTKFNIMDGMSAYVLIYLGIVVYHGKIIVKTIRLNRLF